jgi:amino acid adenylation domain-containing protein
VLRQRQGSGRSAARTEAVTAAPRSADARSPLSVAQEQLWFLNELAPGHPTYNVGQASRLTGPLDRAALGRALDRVVARHEALRTTFGSADGEPFQIVHPPAPARLVYDDVTGPDAERRGLLLLHEQEVHRPFDLRQGPLFRARLVRLDPQTHLLCLVMHHIVGDGWSMSLIQQELAELYRAERAGEPPGLAEPPLQYADFVHWQRRELTGPALAEHLAYWEQRLAGLPVLDLPTDRPRPPVNSFRGATVEYALGREVWPAVDEYARGHGTSRFAVLVAAFNAMLARYAGTDDVVTGTTLTGRARPELEPVVGYFANMGVLRLDTSGDPSFDTLVERARDACMGALEHQEAPFEKVVERVAPPRDPSRNPLFQVAFQQLDQRNWSVPELPGLRSEPVDLRLQRARFDLITSVIDHGDRYTSLTEYSTDLFDESRILRMLAHFERLLRAGLAEPATPLSRLPLLDDAERRAVLDFAKGPRTDYRRAPVHALITERAAQAPDDVAVRDGATSLRYAELVTRARGLAAALRGRGVGKGDIVGVLLDRSADEIVTIVAVLLAGGVYTPLDPAAPPARQARILARAAASVVVTRTEHAGLLAQAEGVSPILLDRETPDAVPDDEAWDEWTDADSLAYALHTSGSTGTPKAVLLSHGGFANYLSWMVSEWQLGRGDRVLHVCAPVFDLAAGEVLSALTAGATVVVASREVALSPGALPDLLRSERVSHMFVTPTLLGLIEPGSLPDLREVLVGGEVLGTDLVRRWTAPGRRFRNLYGPAETTVGCMAYDATDWIGPGLPPIGRPMPNRMVYVLEPSGQPAPIGVPGEIVVGGDGVGLGYLNDADRTTAAFVADPFAPPGRAYRTGDVGYWRADGNLQFMGRRDGQVKLRGLRIELEEIESVLTRCPGVAHAAVAMRPDASGSQELVAYVVTGAADVPTADLRTYLAGQLPAFMVPGRYVFLEALPLTATGKVDRRALPEPARVADSAQDAYVPARTPAERQVAEAFAAVLGRDRVSATDSFFDLGGHSLQAAYVLARLARETGVAVPLSAFYADSGVSAIARLLSTSDGGSATNRAGQVGSAAQSSLVTIKGTGGRPRLYCPHAVSGSPYWYLGLSRALHPDQPMDAFEAPGLEGDETPIEDLRDLAARYVAALRQRQPAGPYLLAGWSMGGFLAFEMARQLAAAGTPPRMVVMIDSNVPGPLPRPSEQEILQTFVQDMAGVAGLPAPAVDPAVAALDSDHRLDRLREILVGAELIPSDVTTGFLAGRFAVFRANMLSIYSYRPEVYPGRVTMFQAAEEDSRDGWRAYAGGGYETVVLPGTHYSMWSPPHLPRLASALEEQIALALAED